MTPSIKPTLVQIQWQGMTTKQQFVSGVVMVLDDREPVEPTRLSLVHYVLDTVRKEAALQGVIFNQLNAGSVQRFENDVDLTEEDLLPKQDGKPLIRG